MHSSMIKTTPNKVQYLSQERTQTSVPGSGSAAHLSRVSPCFHSWEGSVTLSISLVSKTHQLFSEKSYRNSQANPLGNP